MTIYVEEVQYFGAKIFVACDGRCDKAWGHSQRPALVVPEDTEDVIAWLPDDLLGIAPADPGTYEGFHGKPEIR